MTIDRSAIDFKILYTYWNIEKGISFNKLIIFLLWNLPYVSKL
jgi:hypothetical protein